MSLNKMNISFLHNKYANCNGLKTQSKINVNRSAINGKKVQNKKTFPLRLRVMQIIKHVNSQFISCICVNPN